MSDQDVHSTNDTGKTWWNELAFLRIFQGFRMAVQPGKMLLALGGVVLLFIGGWILDGLAGPQVLNNVVVSSGETGLSEIEAYAQGIPEEFRGNLQAYREQMRSKNEEYLLSLLNRLDLSKVASVKDIRNGDALEELKENYEEELEDAVETLEDRYEGRKDYIDEQYEDKLDSEADKLEATLTRDRIRNDLEQAYEGLLQAMLTGDSSGRSTDEWLSEVVASKANTSADKKKISRVIQLAQAYRVARQVKGTGIFESIVDFKLTKAHNAISALVWHRDLATAGQEIKQWLMVVCWMTRFHPIYVFFLMLYGLVIWAIVGGAICRMAALQAARDERIGAFRALQFSMSKFGSFFTAPLIPIAIILLIALLIFFGGILGAIPVVGEWIAGLLTGLTLFGGFVMALVMLGLAGSYNLMYPTIAVEGSDSFDAISRSFSYLFARPWRMGFYTLIMAVYGGICYLFVRFFAFVMLLMVHTAVGASMNWDGSSLAVARGKLDAIWPQPTFAHLQPGVSWASLNWSESIGAFFICIWVALTVGLVLAFVISYFYSVNTIIYTLLRKHVDDTDLEDVFLEHDVENLLSEELAVEEVTPDKAQAKVSEGPAGDEPAADTEMTETPKMPDTEGTDEKPEEDEEDKKD